MSERARGPQDSASPKPYGFWVLTAPARVPVEHLAVARGSVFTASDMRVHGREMSVHPERNTHREAADSKGDCVQALEVLEELNASGRRKLPNDVPVGFIPKRLERIVLADGRPDRRAWECALLLQVRTELRAGNLEVDYSKRFGPHPVRGGNDAERVIWQLAEGVVCVSCAPWLGVMGDAMIDAQEAGVERVESQLDQIGDDGRTRQQGI